MITLLTTVIMPITVSDVCKVIAVARTVFVPRSAYMV